MKYPTCKFEHFGEQFTPARGVADDHPMVAQRPDLFTDKVPAKPRKPSKPRATAATTKKE